jgi:hypothetical protein
MVILPSKLTIPVPNLSPGNSHYNNIVFIIYCMRKHNKTEHHIYAFFGAVLFIASFFKKPTFLTSEKNKKGPQG